MESGQDWKIAALTKIYVCTFCYGDFMDNIINELIKLNKKAIKYNEVPVSAVIVRNNKIISKAINKKNSSNIVFDHAEILAIRKACKKLHTWILDDCDLYVSLEPCRMCKEIINQSRIKNVYYFLKNEKQTNFNTNYKFLDLFPGKYFKEDLKYFFEIRR